MMNYSWKYGETTEYFEWNGSPAVTDGSIDMCQAEGKTPSGCEQTLRYGRRSTASRGASCAVYHAEPAHPSKDEGGQKLIPVMLAMLLIVTASYLIGGIVDMSGTASDALSPLTTQSSVKPDYGASIPVMADVGGYTSASGSDADTAISELADAYIKEQTEALASAGSTDGGASDN